MSSETTTLVNHTPAGLWLPTRKSGGEEYGAGIQVPPKTKAGPGRLDGVPLWYVDELDKERAWERRFRSREVTIGDAGRNDRPRSRADVRADHAEDEARELRSRVAQAEARASRVAQAEDEARELREKARADQKRIADLEAELAAAKKVAEGKPEKPEKGESKKG